MCAVLPCAESETNRKVETEQELVDALTDSSVDIITLKNDIAIGTTLTVLRKVTLDLNGYVLKMTGSGALTMNGGNIVGCIAENGGGLFLSDGSFTMNAGSIVGCSTPNRLTTGEAFYGGIYAFGPMANGDTTGVITLTGGLIKNNGRYAINAVYKTTIYANAGEVYGEVYLNQACKITCLAEDNGITAFKGKTVIGGASGVNANNVDWGLFYGGLYIYGNTTGVIVTYKDGDSEYAKQVLPSGTLATRPDDPATTPDCTFGGWNKADGTAWDYASDKVTDNITLYAKWTANTYTITFDTAGGSEITPITQDYGTNITAPADPTREGYTFTGWDRDIPTTMPAENITITAKWKDTEKPTGEIIIGTNKWREFLNTLTFGLFFKDTQTVMINAADNSGTVVVSYLVTDQDLSEAEQGSLVYHAYEEPFRIDPNGEYIVYAMLADESLNITYLRSDRITLDNVQPVISGIEDGKTYCEAQTVTIDENNSFTLAPADGEQRIVVTDKAGNTAEMTVTVNDGHTYGEWVSNGDGTHTRQCTVDGCNGLETKDCSGGKAICTERAICEVCGKAYGEPDPKNHTDLKYIPAKAATEDAEGNIEYWYCEGCNKYYSDKDGTKEIKKADTVTAKLPKSPQTGDNSNLILWIALLFISGGAVISITVYSKKKKENAE